MNKVLLLLCLSFISSCKSSRTPENLKIEYSWSQDKGIYIPVGPKSFRKIEKFLMAKGLKECKMQESCKKEKKKKPRELVESCKYSLTLVDEYDNKNFIVLLQYCHPSYNKGKTISSITVYGTCYSCGECSVDPSAEGAKFGCHITEDGLFPSLQEDCMEVKLLVVQQGYKELLIQSELQEYD